MGRGKDASEEDEGEDEEEEGCDGEAEQETGPKRRG